MGRGNPRAQFDPGSRTISRPEWRASDFGRRAISHSGFRRPDCFGASGSVDIATTCRLRPCSGECSTSARNRVTSCLAALTDGVILLVEPNFTPQQAARQAKQDIEAAGGRLLGVVLWRRP